MVDGLIGGLLLAFFLSMFGFDNICVDFVKEIFNKTITNSTYYMVFAILGIIFGGLKWS
jgi:hypothetical protein